MPIFSSNFSWYQFTDIRCVLENTYNFFSVKLLNPMAVEKLKNLWISVGKTIATVFKIALHFWTLLKFVCFSSISCKLILTVLQRTSLPKSALVSAATWVDFIFRLAFIFLTTGLHSLFVTLRGRPFRFLFIWLLCLWTRVLMIRMVRRQRSIYSISQNGFPWLCKNKIILEY